MLTDKISIRDYFAAQALPACIREVYECPPREYQIKAWFGNNASGITTAQMAAALAYDYADAVVKHIHNRK